MSRSQIMQFLRHELSVRSYTCDSVRLIASDCGLPLASFTWAVSADVLWMNVLEATENAGCQAALRREVLHKAPALSHNAEFLQTFDAWILMADRSAVLPLGVQQIIGQATEPSSLVGKVGGSGPRADGLEARQGDVEPGATFVAVSNATPAVRSYVESRATSLAASNATPDVPTLTLLHLSDLHFGQAQSDAGSRWNQLRVIEDLRADIRQMASRLTKPDLILMTGDIAFSGQRSEYEAAESWINKVLEDLKIPNDRIRVVPGNHDVDRDIVVQNRFVHVAHNALRSDLSLLEHYLEPDSKMQLELNIWPKLAEFSRFSTKWPESQISPSLPWWKQLLPTPLGPAWIVGLNTVLVSGDSEDAPATLVLGAGQLLRVFGDLPPEALVVILMHHPPEWLLDGGNLLTDLCKYPHVLFTGHIHEQGGRIVSPFHQAELLSFSAGAAHAGLNAEEKHAYAWVQLSSEGVSYYPRFWSSDWGQFQAERNNFELDGNDRFLKKRAKLPERLEKFLDPTRLSRAMGSR